MATSKKTVVITGCTKGSIGDALAQEFARRGCHVIATGRSLHRISQLSSLGIETMELDLMSSESIQNFSSQIHHVDILFNNAGIFLILPFTDTTDEDWKRIFQTNVFGTVELTRTLIPLLIQSKGMIVNHTSQSAYSFQVYGSAYGASKAALAATTDVLRIELKPFGIRVMELITGIVQSNITIGGGIQASALPNRSLYEPAKSEIEYVFGGGGMNDNFMKGDEYARQVVSDTLDGQALWVWRGYMANAMYWVWFIKCHWKGIMDRLLFNFAKLDVLQTRLQEQRKSN